MWGAGGESSKLAAVATWNRQTTILFFFYFFVFVFLVHAGHAQQQQQQHSGLCLVSHFLYLFRSLSLSIPDSRLLIVFLLAIFKNIKYLLRRFNDEAKKKIWEEWIKNKMTTTTTSMKKKKI